MIEELSPAPSPLETAARLRGLPYLAFLDSAAVHTPSGRYSFLAADPFEVIEATGRRITATSQAGDRVQSDGNVLEFVRRRLAPFQARPVGNLPPFQGGAAGYIGYDFGALLERIPPHRSRDIPCPDVVLGLYDWVIAWDHAVGKAWIISTGMPAEDGRAERAEVRLGQVKQWLTSRVPAGVPSNALPAATPIGFSFTREAYLATVQRVVDYILAGDVFQVNLSQRFHAPAPVEPFVLYRRLREINPAPFAAYLGFGDTVIASASPERFLQFDPLSRQVETRPIKGTRPRGATPAEDAILRQSLLASEKDRAENVMIVDLLRNDLSRVCEPGTVRVPRLLELEEHPTVFHLVSTITGRLREGRDPVDLLCAAFPGGSITGAPKVRAMEIIAELEPTHRGPYCGTIGYLSVTGAMDSSIVIRTFVMAGGTIFFQAGGGVVADSVPEAEYRETLDKAKALFEALNHDSSDR